MIQDKKNKREEEDEEGGRKGCGKLTICGIWRKMNQDASFLLARPCHH